MRKSCFVYILLFVSFLQLGFSQTRRALIIGINDYYYRDAKTNQIVRDPANSLKGCENDAKSVKELIISRFGFKAEGIKELYSAQATKKNILDELDKMLKASKTGDNVFFYYSGHGVQMPNASGNSTDEAIAPTDVLYQKNGFILSLQLAAIFNTFVDKKITLTTIFDCCHSWGTRTVVVKSGDKYVVKEESNVGSGGNINNQNTGGGFFQEFEALDLDEPLAGMQEEPNGGTEIRELNFYDYQSHTEGLTDTLYISDEKFITEIKKDNGAAVSSKLLGENVGTAVGPAKRVNSNFLFLSATDDDQVALEKADESRNRHGVFTKALIEVFKKNPPTITAQQVFNKIGVELKKRNYSQTPTLRSAPERKSKNLLGVSPAWVKKDVFTKCIAASNGTLTFDKGALTGILKGNILQDITNPAVTVEVQSQSGENNAIATAAKGKALLGHTFKIVSWYVKSDPLLKVYIPKQNFTLAELTAFLIKKVKPLLQKDNVPGLYNNAINFRAFEASGSFSKIFVTPGKISYVNGKTQETKVIPDISKKTIEIVNQNNAFFIYLPPPSEACTLLEAMCKKDQNIQMVDDPAQADVSFYCAYTKSITESKDITSKPIIPETTPEFDLLSNIFVQSPNNQDISAGMFKESKPQSSNLVLAYSKETVGPALNSNKHQPLIPFILIETDAGLGFTSPQEMAQKMYSWLLYTASKRGVWLNGWAKK
ncbi:MAG: caspase family protein [Sphingobacteriales bacterium]|nr:caspase family protein [Sphingobacteriales bacterium]